MVNSLSCPITCRFDGFRLTGKITDFSRFTNLLKAVTDFLPAGDSFLFLDRSRFMGKTYYRSFNSVRGKIEGGYNLGDDCIEFLLSIPGTYCSQLPSDNFFPLIQLLSDCKFTRCDIALDDFRRRVSHNEVKECGDNGYYRLVDSYKYIHSCLARGMVPVSTCYFGNSDKILRFYDAEFMHGIQADRWELQLRDDHAQSLINAYLSGDFLASYVCGAIDFGTGSRSNNFRRFNWWQSLINDAGGSLRLQLPVFEPSFLRSWNWLENQAASTLAVAFDAWGPDNFQVAMNHLIQLGRSRFTSYHHAYVSQLRKEDFTRYLNSVTDYE